jgi:hypothetical protein
MTRPPPNIRFPKEQTPQGQNPENAPWQNRVPGALVGNLLPGGMDNLYDTLVEDWTVKYGNETGLYECILFVGTRASFI